MNINFYIKKNNPTPQRSMYHLSSNVCKRSAHSYYFFFEAFKFLGLQVFCSNRKMKICCEQYLN